MDSIQWVNSFVNLVLPLIILLAGFIGNVMGLMVQTLKRKRLVKMGPSSILTYLLLADTVYLHQIITTYIIIGLENDFQVESNMNCRLNRYFSYWLAPISPWLLVYISVDRLISIKFSTRRETLRKKQAQLFYFIALIVFNLVYYSPVCFFSQNKYFGLNLNGSYDLITDQNKENYNQTRFTCTLYTDANIQTAISMMNSVNLVILPFIIMIGSSIILIDLIISSRKRVQINYSPRENKIFRRDIKFARTAISFNLYFLLTNLPLNLLAYLPFFSSSVYFLIYMLFYYIFLASYAGNFYIIVLTNNLFRKEFFQLFVYRQPALSTVA